MNKIPVGIRVNEELMERLHNAIWHIGRGLSITSVATEALEQAIVDLESLNGGKPFPPRTGEVPKSPLKPKKRSR